MGKLQPQYETNQNTPNMWLRQIWEHSEATTTNTIGKEKKSVLEEKEKEGKWRNQESKKRKEIPKKKAAKAIENADPKKGNSYKPTWTSRWSYAKRLKKLREKKSEQ